MSQPDPDLSASRRMLSALVDGEATGPEEARACQAWREGEDARAAWHAYHLIGDVLRSDDLAAPAEGSRRLLAALRERLADEPAVLAPPRVAAGAAVVEAAQPEPRVANARAGVWLRAHWQAPVAMAAGFLAVVGGLQLVQAPRDGSARLALTGASGPAAGAAAATVVSGGFAPAAPPTAAQTEQLAPYLAAHRLSTMNAALQMPAGGLRNAALVQTAPR